MFKKLKQSKTEGFTIIEVMIVLAIAGLILLIVFLAVPALQRSSRNTQRKNDASAVATAVANYLTNNGGQLPTEVSDSGASTLVIGTGANANSENAKLGYYTTKATGTWGASDGTMYITSYTTGSIPAITATESTASSATNITQQTISIFTGLGCNSTNTGLSTTASPRSAAVLYSTESGSSDALQCIEQ